MDKREENRYSMYMAVDGVFKTYDEYVQGRKGLARFRTRFSADLDTIRSEDRAYLNFRKGASATKAAAEEKLIDLAADMAGLLEVYGEESENPSVAEFSTISDSSLKMLRDTELLEKAQSMVIFARQHDEGLAEYDVTAEELDELDSAVKAYEQALQQKEVDYGKAQVARANLSDAFAKASDTLDKLDKLMRPVERKNPAFYDEYAAARQIIDHAATRSGEANPESQALAQ
jgi:chromosome segregation ATPase